MVRDVSAAVPSKGHIFWLSVDVILFSPLTLLDEEDHPEGLVSGAIMEFGVTAQSETEAKAVAEGWICQAPQFRDLVFRVQYDHVGEIFDVEKEVYADSDVAEALLQDPHEQGLWYRTAVGWYSDDEALDRH